MDLLGKIMYDCTMIAADDNAREEVVEEELLYPFSDEDLKIMEENKRRKEKHRKNCECYPVSRVFYKNTHPRK